MEYHWLLPPPGTVKINVHGATPLVPFMNGNTSDIGVVARNSNDGLKKLSVGSIPGLSPLHNQLWVIQHGLNRAFEEDYMDLVLEIDNLEAFNVLKYFSFDVLVEVADTAKKILLRLHDPRWIYSIVYVFPERNKLATYLASLGGGKCKQIYTFSRPIGCVEELMSLDLGFGLLDDKFQDVEVPIEAPYLVDFGPIHLSELMHNGYGFEEDVVMVENEAGDSLIMIDIHNVMEEYIIIVNGYDGEFMGDIPY